MTCTGRIHLNMTMRGMVLENEDSFDKMTLWRGLHDAPDGVRVIIDIGDREYVTQAFAIFAHEHVDRLQIEVWGYNGAAVKKFVHAVRTGEVDNFGAAA